MKDDNPGTMKPVPKTKIDLRGWLLLENGDAGALKKVNDWVAEHVTFTLRDVFEENPPRIAFACGWANGDGRNNKWLKDPATVYVSFPLGATEDDNVCYACSLEGAIDDLIELHEDGRGIFSARSGKVTDPDGQRILHEISARLRELADKLDKACE